VSLEKVLEFGISKNYFKKLQIKNIDKSCCSLDFEIIDFDKTKDKICKENSQVPRKSCDGLCLKNSIDFIEFKSLNHFFNKEFKFKLQSNKLNKAESEIIEEKVKKFNFQKKIRDSIWLLDYIVNHQELQLSNSEQEKFYQKTPNYFIVKDNYQPLINIMEQFNILANNKHNKLSNRETMDILIEKELDNITVVLNKPRLIDCNDLKKYLEEKK